jgi:hypothetical protein
MAEGTPRADEGGESACFAHLTCPECGVVLDGSAHSPECDWVQLLSIDATKALKPELND